MTVKAYARRSKCSAGPSPASTRGDLLDETSKQFLQAFLDPAEIDWLTKAARLPGRSLHLAVLLVCLAKAAKTRQVEFSNSASQQFGLDRNAKYRGLCWLEEAGLVRVERKIGRSPAVTILDHRVRA